MARTGSRRLDVTRSGSRTYTDDERERVRRAFLAHLGPQRAVTQAELSDITGIDGRTVRAVISDIDGVECLVCGGDEGLWVAVHAEQGDPLTRRFRAHAMAELERVSRRVAYADEHLPRLQGRLFH